MTRRCFVATLLALVAATALAGEGPWKSWPPRDYLVKSLAADVPKLLKAFHADTGKFGSKPWICSDQNRIYPLAAAWALEHPDNPWFHNPKVLEAIAKGGEALVDEMDKNGKWTFRKKDNSTWGQIHMPWTYSRWVRAYHLVRDALPAASRAKWEKGLLLGFKGIRRYANSHHVHNIPTHHAMGLYIAGECFGNNDWKQAAKGYMARVVKKQNPVGYWSEHFGPVVGYNRVYVEALGVYYHFSRDPAVLPALQRSARFHASVLWPDGSAVACIDERVAYRKRVDVGNVGFAWTPEGRGFLLKQVGLHSKGGERLVGGDYAATMLLYGSTGDAIAPATDRDHGTVALGNNDAVIRRDKPWTLAFSGYACKPIKNRWIQDRHGLIDVFHDTLGLVVGGGNTKLQPYWSTFTVGDPTLLSHKKGETHPNFVPKIDLLWTPDKATIANAPDATTMNLTYGAAACRVSAQARADGTLALTYHAPKGQRVEAHVPLYHRAHSLRTANGQKIRLTNDNLLLTSKQVGGHFIYKGLKVTMPKGASLRWPTRQHNPYKRDGSASLAASKLVLVLPFDTTDSHTVVLSLHQDPPFDGLAFEARDLPVVHTEGTYTKRLDDLGSQYLGAAKVGGAYTFTLPAIKAGRYELLADFVMAYCYGIVKVSVDGTPLGKPFDAWCEGVDSEGERVAFGTVDLAAAPQGGSSLPVAGKLGTGVPPAAGPHKITVEVIGQNPKSTRPAISVKRWLLRRITP